MRAGRMAAGECRESQATKHAAQGAGHMSDETTYERAVEHDRESDYQCRACGEYCGTTFCGECCRLRQDEAERIADALTAAKQWATEAHDARWDEDTIKTRQRLLQQLRTALAVAFRLATGEAL